MTHRANTRERLTIIPTKHVSNVAQFFGATQTTHHALPMVQTHIQAGFPSPADDYIECKLDLNEHLIKHPAATFFVRVTGDSMIGAGINSGDILIVDRALQATDNKIVIAYINGEFTVKRITKKKNALYLMPENDNFDPIEITPEMDFEIWGVVSYVIHQTT